MQMLGERWMPGARKWRARLGLPRRTSRTATPRNSYRLVVKVRFQNGIVMIEWGGTHAEYDKKSFGQ